MTVNREAAYEAVNKMIREFQTNALQNAIIWRFVQVALDAAEDDLDDRQIATRFVVMDRGEPVHVAPTKREARWVRRFQYPGATIRKVIS